MTMSFYKPLKDSSAGLRAQKPLSGEILQAVKKLVITECANWQRTGPLGISNYCWMKEKTNSGVCVYFNQELPKCSYFELAVLPLDADLKEDYFIRKESNGRKTENRPAIQRKGVGGSPGSLKGVSPKPSGPGVSVGESIRQGLLSRPAFHGVDSEKQVKGH